MSIINRVKAALQLGASQSKAEAEEMKAVTVFLTEARNSGLENHVKKTLINQGRVKAELAQADAETKVLEKVDKIQDWIESTLVEMEQAKKLPEQRKLWQEAQAQRDEEIIALLDALNFKQH